MFYEYMPQASSSHCIDNDFFKRVGRTFIETSNCDISLYERRFLRDQMLIITYKTRMFYRQNHHNHCCINVVNLILSFYTRDRYIPIQTHDLTW